MATTYPWEQYSTQGTPSQSQSQTQANPWEQYKPKTYTFYGGANDIALAKANGMQGNFIDISTYGQDSIVKDLQHAWSTGANPYVLGGAGATRGISDEILSRVNQNGVNIARIGGKDRYEVQENLKNFYNQQAQAPLDFSQLRTEQASIEDIAKKYGIDFSRDYAKRQAEAEAQAKRIAVEAQQRQNATSKQENLQSINNSVRDASQGIDRSYFLQGLQQAQNQTNSGLNAGIAADQNLRLTMAQQAELAPVYRDAALARSQENNRFTNEELDLLAQMGLINTESLAREESLYSDRLWKGMESAMQLTEAERAQNNNFAQWMLSQRGQNLDNIQAYNQLQENSRQFDANLDWNKYQYANMSAAERSQSQLAYAQLAQEKAQFASEDAWRRYTYNNMSASDKAQLDRDIKQFGETMAWNKYELEYSSKMSLATAQAQSGATYGNGIVGPPTSGTVSGFKMP